VTYADGDGEILRQLNQDTAGQNYNLMGWPVDTDKGLLIAVALVAGFLILKK